MTNVCSLGGDLDQRRVAEGRLAVVDACADTHENALMSGEFDLSDLTAHRKRYWQGTGEKPSSGWCSIIIPLFRDAQFVRRELQWLVIALRQLEVIAMITVERTGKDKVTRFDVEKFMVDNIVILRNHLVDERRPRIPEALKFRGGAHQKVEFAFTIDPVDGIDIAPIPSLAYRARVSNKRISLGVQELDDVCEGGIFHNNIVLVSGATGIGKTLMVTEFMKSGIEASERSLLVSFEEDHEQLLCNAASWGIDLKAAKERGLLKILCDYRERPGMEDHLIHLRPAMLDVRPERVAINSNPVMKQSTTPARSVSSRWKL
jgi:circadian clock protein KaiC